MTHPFRASTKLQPTQNGERGHAMPLSHQHYEREGDAARHKHPAGESPVDRGFATNSSAVCPSATRWCLESQDWPTWVMQQTASLFDEGRLNQRKGSVERRSAVCCASRLSPRLAVSHRERERVVRGLQPSQQRERESCARAVTVTTERERELCAGCDRHNRERERAEPGSAATARRTWGLQQTAPLFVAR